MFFTRSHVAIGLNVNKEACLPLLSCASKCQKTSEEMPEDKWLVAGYERVWVSEFFVCAEIHKNTLLVSVNCNPSHLIQNVNLLRETEKRARSLFLCKTREAGCSVWFWEYVGQLWEIKPPRQSLEVTLPSPAGEGALTGPEHASLMSSSSFFAACACGSQGSYSCYMLRETSVFHSRVRVDILSTFLSFLHPDIAIDIPHNVSSFLVKLFFTIYF